MAVRIGGAPCDFNRWDELLRLVQDAFAFMEGRIDPPSSVRALTATSIAQKAHEENLFLATDGDELIGCVFARQQGDSLCVSKLAVRQDRQRQGVARRLMHAVAEHARFSGLPALVLDTRIELTENHATFAAMGFVGTGEHSHEGYDRPTFVTMRKTLAGRE